MRQQDLTEGERICREIGIPESEWHELATEANTQKLEDYFEFNRARRRAVSAIRGTVAGWIPACEFVFPYRGLARRITLRPTSTAERKQLAPAPFGWRYAKELDRCAVVLMPAWLYFYHWLHANRWALHHLLTRLGFWSLKEEGGDYREGQWNWRWWRGADRMYNDCVRHWERRTSVLPISYCDYATAVMPAWWFKLGWWFARATAHVRMPRWT